MPYNLILELLPPFGLTAVTVIGNLFMGDPFGIRNWAAREQAMFVLGILALWGAVFFFLQQEFIEGFFLIHSSTSLVLMVVCTLTALISVAIAWWKGNSDRPSTWLLIPFLVAQLLFVLSMEGYINAEEFYVADIGHRDCIKSALLARGENYIEDSPLDVRGGRYVIVTKEEWDDPTVTSIGLYLFDAPGVMGIAKEKMRTKYNKLVFPTSILENIDNRMKD